MFEEEIQTHEVLFSGSSLEIGKIQWYILKSDSEMQKRCYVQPKEQKQDTFDLMEEKLTAFGREVHPDEIHWWIFKKEKAHEELLEQTKRTYSSTQKLKLRSASLKKANPDSYQDLIKSIKKFTEENTPEIQDLLNYVIWLRTRDELAPAMLFTFRVWGSTRSSDRMIRIDKEKIEDDQESVRACTEIALGLRDRLGYTIGRIHNEIAEKIYESLEFEEEQPPYVAVPQKDLLRKTTFTVLNELAIYFEFLRNSMREIIIDVGKYFEPNRLLEMESFWKEFITKAMANDRVETQLWDFKETLEMWKCKPEKRTDFETSFSEKVAAFMNDSGGVIIIGITDAVPRKIVGIEDLESKIKNIQDVLKRHIGLASVRTRLEQIRLRDEKDSEKNCLVLVAAQTKDPVEIENQQGWSTYPLRRGTGLTTAKLEEIKELKETVSKDNYNFLSRLYVFTHDVDENNP